MKNVFDLNTTEEIVNRINKLSPTSQALWGKMTVAQMLAHCNVIYELVYEEDKHKKPNAFMRFIMKTFVKKVVVGDAQFKQSLRTAPMFIIKDDKNFESEKERLIGHISKTQSLGGAHFDQKESHSFGVLSLHEWNNMFYKHLDHHLNQFSV